MAIIVTTVGTTLKARLFIRKDGKVMIYLPKSMVDDGYLAKTYKGDLTKGIFLDATLNIDQGTLLLGNKQEQKELVVQKVK